MKKYALLLVITLLPFWLIAGVYDGNWSGQLELGQAKLPIVFHIYGDSVTLDSPVQGAKGIPATVTYRSDSILINVRTIGAKYHGLFKNGTIEGSFMQSGMTLPLQLSPQQPKAYNRPQTPKPPFPYKEKEVSFFNSSGCELFGTLTHPSKIKRTTPAVLLVSGSGLQNRDEEIFMHKPFSVIADYLTRNGVAVLRYDDRSVGKSLCDAKNGTTYDFMLDAQAGVEYLRKQFKGLIGIIGHSEGGQIAFMLASRQIPDFIITLAAPGVSGREILLSQNIHAMRQNGASEEEIKKMLPILHSQFDSVVELWLRHFIDYDPSKDIATSACPILVIQGDKDVQVEAYKNLTAIRKLLPHNPLNRISLLPDHNHLLQRCQTGEVSEYIEIEETLSPIVLQDMLLFIENIVKNY